MKLASYLNPNALPTLQRYGLQRTVVGLQAMLDNHVIDINEFSQTLGDVIIVNAMRTAETAMRGEQS